MNRILRIIGLTSSSTLLLFALSACDEAGDYESDPRSIQVIIDEEPEGETGRDGTDDGGSECVCECPGADETDPDSGPGNSGGKGKGKGNGNGGGASGEKGGNGNGKGKPD